MLKTKAYTYFIALALAFGTAACVPLEQQGQTGSTTGGTQSQLRYEDFIYADNVKSVQTYRVTGTPQQVLEPAVVSLNEARPIVLEFDRINAGPQRLIAKLVHCNADWTPSGLNETQYLNAFNEFFITDVQNSVNTRIPYVHYRFEVPRVKLSGNYLLVVSEEGGNLLLTRRLLVYQDAVTVTAKLGAPVGPSGRETRQPVEFNVFYPDFPILSPMQEVKAVMRQNYRWDNAKAYHPTYVHDAQRRLEYVFFDPQEQFKGLSEFRAFDTRSLNFNDIGVESINLQASPIEVNLLPDADRQNAVYSQDPDINGQRIFGNKQYGYGEVNGDYTWVDFELKVPEAASGEVYIMGELTGWRPQDNARMIYDIGRSVYSGRLLLKQGYYNYYYTLKSNNAAAPDASYFEGSHFETDNVYDILIYYRPPGSRADLLVGYQELFFNRK
ncbi:DUF5103 domain-containing protein [Pontibacter sp. 172403-2]|uniref:type IX secretion system plug protein n=1 Tax=Pontibacter rufus TaxID=2791028 RepID=UPI0018AF986F|nr:DUF5103 domain-containing protein [Pontibacter sp. 172403-2]MBF9254319.1 DUF5103 domain-containing protein [Pontibacter sp. 172403-2]